MKIPTLGDAGKILDKRIEQIVKIAGDGRLIDGGETTKEFREFLANVPDSTYLGRYVNECLQQPFESSGLVLQDLINEVGKRLGFKVEHGRYAGTKKELPEMISQWAKKLGVSPRNIFVQKMKTKWGSCNHQNKSIRHNTELTKKPKQYLDYVVLHEMAHLLKPTHSREFIRILDKQMPMWREIKKALNRLPVGA